MVTIAFKYGDPPSHVRWTRSVGQDLSAANVLRTRIGDLRQTGTASRGRDAYDNGLIRVKPLLVWPHTSSTNERNLEQSIHGNAHHGLNLEKLFEAKLAPFAAISGLFVASEGSCIIDRGTVEVHVPRAKARRHL